jgi:hypothetical protein
MKAHQLVIAVAATLVLAGCSTASLFRDSPQEASQPDLSPNNSLDEPIVDSSQGTLSADQIRKVLSGKSWRWQGSKLSGVTLYADDGSSLIEVTGKGTTTGKWEARDGQLCESVAPAPFLPKGLPMKCQPMTGSDGTYTVGQATFTLA